MKIYDIRVLHRVCPLGIDTLPYFSWKMRSDEQNVLQMAYRIVVREEDKIVWDSGIVQSDAQTFISYEGAALKSRTRYRAEVTVWDNHGNTAKSETWFETAFLEQSCWQAKWIESTFPRNENKAFTYGIENPPVWFKKKFSLQGNVKSARLYATCYGTYRPYLNSGRIGDGEFAPEFTPYDKILNYQVYDCTALFKTGENELKFLVGDGWYFCDQTKVVTDKSRPAPAVLFQLEMQMQDGSVQRICSDGTELCELSDTVFSDLFMGEKVDKTRALPAPQAVAVRDYGYEILRCQPMDQIRAVEEFAAKKIYVSPKGETIVDFGQVIAGRIRVKINVPKGKEVTFEHSEVVDKDGNYFQVTIARQCDTYVSDGKSVVFEPKFTFHGFRYVRVTGIDNPKKEDFTAVLLSTPKENLSKFECSDERLNRLYKNIRYSQKNNMMSVPTDCPTREKAAWSGDILIYVKAALLNEDMTPFLTSWLSGLIADQFENGVVTLISPFTQMYKTVVERTVAPFGDKEHTGIAGWSDAIVWVPYAMYEVTGNKRILKECLPAMKKWCDYIIKTSAEKRGSDMPEGVDRYLFNTGFHFGEWLVPGKPHEGFEVCKETAPYIAPYYAYKSICMMRDVCSILGEDGSMYAQQAEKIKWAINEAIFKRDKLPEYYQGAYVLAFAFDLVPPELYEEYKQRLVALVEQNGNKLCTGFLATPFVLDVLDKIGRSDLANKMFMQTEQPSWLYEVKMGATTIWEWWGAMNEDGSPNKTSFDHYAFGVVDDWIMHRVCGIQAEEAGYKRIKIAPVPTEGLDEVSRSFVCEYGDIKVQYNKKKLNVTIPCNTTATVCWKGKSCQVGSGTYIFD